MNFRCADFEINISAGVAGRSRDPCTRMIAAFRPGLKAERWIDAGADVGIVSFVPPYSPGPLEAIADGLAALS